MNRVPLIKNEMDDTKVRIRKLSAECDGPPYRIKWTTMDGACVDMKEHSMICWSTVRVGIVVANNSPSICDESVWCHQRLKLQMEIPCRYCHTFSFLRQCDLAIDFTAIRMDNGLIATISKECKTLSIKGRWWVPLQKIFGVVNWKFWALLTHVA